MGACIFITESAGKDSSDAFLRAVRDARHENGNGGYTGTIAEKSEFINIGIERSEDPYEKANNLLDRGDPRVSDKWGPCGCIELTNTTYAQDHSGKKSFVFFGWASE